MKLSLSLAFVLAGLSASVLAQGFGPELLAPALELDKAQSEQPLFALDMNADGRLDLLAADIVSEGCLIILQQADGGFAPGVVESFTVGGFTLPEPRPADFDVDGVPDVVSTWENGCSIRLNDGSGDLGVLHISNVPDGVFREALAAADFNGDELPDVLLVGVAAGSGTLLGAKGSGDGNLGPYGALAAVREPLDLQPADLDGDGDLDLILLEKPYILPELPHGLTTFLNEGDGTLVPTETSITLGKGSVSPPADVDADGLPDVFAFDQGDSAVHLLHGDGAGGFVASELVSSIEYFSVQDARAVDLDADGFLDLVTAGTAGLVLQRLVRVVPVGSPVELESPFSATQLAPGDFDGDGLVGIATIAQGAFAGGYKVLVLENALGPFIDVGLGSPGGPVLQLDGNPAPGESVTVTLQPAGAPGPGLLAVGLHTLLAETSAGLIVPDPIALLPLSLPASLQAVWPALPQGTLVYLQGVALGSQPHAGNAVVVVSEP